MKRYLTILLLAITLQSLAQGTFIKKNYFDNEKTRIKEIVTLKSEDSTLHGPYNSFYANGSLEISGFYEDNDTDSTWTYYFENGRKKASGLFSNGLQTGKWRYYFENGNKKVEGIFKKSSKHGQWTFYYENGQEKSSGIYFNDKKEGIWNYFYEEGSLKAQAYYEQGNGPYKEFYSSGKLRAEGMNKNDESEGLWTYYYESGEKEAEGEYQDGVRHGMWKYYHKNGQVAAEGRFEHGEKTGVWKYYYSDGSISSEGQMERNTKDGFWKLYYQSGEVKGEGSYDKGTGEYIEYYINGKQKARGKIENNVKVGKWTFYNEEGQEDGVAIYNDGVGEYEGYYPDGTLKMTGQIQDGKRTGTWKLYNPDGTVAGIYRPVYEEEKPIFRTSSLDSSSDKKMSDKPEYKYKKKKLRYFNPRINEYTGIIVGTNPLWTFTGKLPIAIEYYIQERLGYEAEITIHNKPFFKYQSQLDLEDLFRLGAEVAVKQKFYNTDSHLGMFYFGHQLSAGFIEHGAKVTETQDTLEVQHVINANETRIAYGLFVGDRWMRRSGNSGITLDFNIGFAVGRRFFHKDYEPNARYDQIFSELNQRKFYLPIVFTLNLGFTGPKRQSTSY